MQEVTGRIGYTKIDKHKLFYENQLAKIMKKLGNEEGSESAYSTTMQSIKASDSNGIKAAELVINNPRSTTTDNTFKPMSLFHLIAKKISDNKDNIYLRLLLEDTASYDSETKKYFDVDNREILIKINPEKFHKRYPITSNDMVIKILTDEGDEFKKNGDKNLSQKLYFITYEKKKEILTKNELDKINGRTIYMIYDI